MPELLCKICGLGNEQDVLLCAELGVEFTGFIFAGHSPRYLSPEKAAALPRTSSRRVGVFAGTELAELERIMRVAKLDFAQLHGNEDLEFCQALGPERVIKVLWPERLGPCRLLQEMERFAPACAFFLLEAGQSGGGSGRPLDWNLLPGKNAPRPWLLAGGLGPLNLAAALAACAPDGVDMNSALESEAGKKNPALVREAVALLRTFKVKPTRQTRMDIE